MAITLTTGTGSLNLNGGTLTNSTVVTLLRPLDLGPANRDETWIEPRGNTTPTLAARTDRKTILVIDLALRGTSVANLIADAKLIRDEFLAANNTITYSLGNATTTITTYPSAIDPLTSHHVDASMTIATQFYVPLWRLRIWRHPYLAVETTKLPVG